jgi:hypothetical protein
MMEPELGRPPPPPAGESATPCRPDLAGPCPRSGTFAVTQPTMLTVLTQTPPFRRLTADPEAAGDALEAGAQSDGPDVGVALEVSQPCQRWPGRRTRLEPDLVALSAP